MSASKLLPGRYTADHGWIVEVSQPPFSPVPLKDKHGVPIGYRTQTDAEAIGFARIGRDGWSVRRVTRDEFVAMGGGG